MVTNRISAMTVNTAVVTIVIARGDHSKGMRVARINQLIGTFMVFATMTFVSASLRAGSILFIIHTIILEQIKKSSG